LVAWSTLGGGESGGEHLAATATKKATQRSVRNRILWYRKLKIKMFKDECLRVLPVAAQE
jgi:hypothetical protein